MAALSPSPRSTSLASTSLGAPVPAIGVPAWAWLMAGVAVLVGYVALQDGGLLLQQYAGYVHELTHDGRHALGLPCH